jgi:hypothetical protein
MPIYVLQYDLSSDHIDTNGHTSWSVYQFLASRLQQRGWTRHQYACWKANGKGPNDFFNDAVAIANALETQYGVGIFLNLEYQRHLAFIQIR